MNVGDGLRERLDRLPKPCSLVELGLGPADEAALRDWARFAGPRHLSANPQDFALAFLASATVVARERAAENQLWPHVHAWLRGSPATALFDAACQPVADLKAAIEPMVRRFGLRHVLDRGKGEHEQRWRTTVLLQCGFTKPGLDRLPEWLSGYPPWRAVDLLLHDPDLASESFRETFERLRSIRLGWREDLPSNPWLAGDLHERAGETARSRPSLGTAAAASSAVSPRVRLVEVGGGALAFRLPLGMPPHVAVGAPAHVDVAIGGHRGPRAHRQPDGSYSGLADLQLDIAQVPPSGLLHVRLLGPQDELLHEEEVEVFAGGDDVDLFVHAGRDEYRRVVDPWTEPAPSRAAILRTIDELPLEGVFTRPQSHWCRSRWQRVEPSEMPTARVPLGDDIAWTFHLDGRRPWPGQVEVAGQDEPWSPGSPLAWTARLSPSRARIKSARLGRHPLALEATPESLRLVLPAARSLPLSFGLRLCLEDGGDRFIVACEAPHPTCRHFLTRSGDGWVKLPIADRASLARPVRWFSRGPAGDLPWLFEGQRPVVPLGDREVLLAPRLSGLGAPLRVESRRFNREGRSVTVVESLADSCLLGAIVASEEYATVALAPSFAWSDDFALTTLGQDGVPRDISRADFLIDGQLLVLETSVPPAAVAIVSRGEPLAAAHTDRLRPAIDAAPSVAACVRWLLMHRLPIARSDVRAAVARAISRQPLEAVGLGFGPASLVDHPEPEPREFLFRDELLGGFWRECTEESLDAVEHALVRVADGEPGVARLLLDPNTNPFAHVRVRGNTVARPIERLAAHDPILAARVLRAAFRADDPVLQRVLTSSCDDLAALTARQIPTMDHIAAILGVDDGFVDAHRRSAVEWALNGTVDPLRLVNIRRLLYLPEFRRAVASDALRRLIDR